MRILMLSMLSLVAMFSMNCKPNNAKIEQQAAISEQTVSNAGLVEVTDRSKRQSPVAQTTSQKSTQKPSQTAPSLPDQNHIENKVDFICGMKVTPAFTDTCLYKGKVYAFCSEYCKETFLEKPEKYLKKK